MSPAACAAPVHLRTNALDSPLGIDSPKPVFSWRSNAAAPNWLQTGYEILVGTDAKALRHGQADVWDSGRVRSSESVNIEYGGPALRAQQRYVWGVRTWDNHGGESQSTPAFFEMGLLSPSDWKAQWIMRRDPAAEQELDRMRWMWLPHADARHVPASTPAHFRYILHLADKPQAASLHVLSGGSFTARVNGTETGHQKDWSAFDREEILPFLHGGDNEIVIDVVSDEQSNIPQAVGASIRLTHADGREERIVSGSEWQARAGAQDPWTAADPVGPLSDHFGLGIQDEPIAGPHRVTTGASLFRKEFVLPSKIRSARLTVTALGSYEAMLNGHSVAPGTLLVPGWTDFHKRVQYQTYDVTAVLHRGANALGVMLGGGWYSSPMTWRGIRYTPGPNLLRAQLEVTFSDGSHQTVVTDATWKTSAAPVTFSEIYGGESYDARLIQNGWTSAPFADQNWTAAVTSAPPFADMAVVAQPDLPIHTSITLHPIDLNPANASHPAIYDMGQNMVGNVRLHVRGARGTIVRLRYAERLNPDGSIYTENLRNAIATDTYVLSGNGDESWTPAFTFHGFRYVEFTYLNSTSAPPPSLASIEGLVYNSLPDTPSIRLSSSSALLNKMNELGIWGQRGNFVSIPTDCPQRDERLGWMGDAGVFWRTGSFNFNTDAFTHKFMRDVVDAQSPAGAFRDVSPNILGPKPGAPGWGDAGIFIPYAAWLQYGDVHEVERSWAAMQQWMAFILNSNPDYVRRNDLGNNYGDWLAPDPHTPKDLIGTAYWAMAAQEMAQMAAAMHRGDDERLYHETYEHIADAYRHAFVKPDGAVSGDTQTAYVATLYTGLAPQQMRSGMVDRLAHNIEQHGNHLSTGFLGTPLLLPTLEEFGRADVAFKLLLTDTYPSWGYMVSKGATTWWERWNGDTGDPSMNSYNHYAFGSVMAWVYRRAAGIDTSLSGTGYHHLIVAPHFDGALPQLHVEYDSDYGTIISDWQQADHRFTITIPANTTATVLLPNRQPEEIGSGTHSYFIVEKSHVSIMS